VATATVALAALQAPPENNDESSDTASTRTLSTSNSSAKVWGVLSVFFLVFLSVV